MSVYEIIFKLALAGILGGVIGLERESLNRPAGLRTYTLVCVGSALAMVVSLDMYFQYYQTVNADPGRIAAQVISGIGFRRRHHHARGSHSKRADHCCRSLGGGLY